MKGKIALEEHFAIDDTVDDSAGFVADSLWQELKSRILDVQERRIREMDENGIELSVLSLNAPAVQAIPDPKKAVEIAQKANDYLAEQIQLKPDRFRGFAALPMQDPAEATLELRRCVKDLGFVGALVNGSSQIEGVDSLVYYDSHEYSEFWEEVASLNIPFYLHPRNPVPSDAQIYEGHPWLLGPTWGFAQETAVHALRLIGSGLFDRLPSIQIILGHLGEGIPYNLWRIDNRNAWTKMPHDYAAEKRVVDYFRSNFYLTTSGNFHTPTLKMAIEEIGVERVLFSTDWPFENMNHASDWFDSAEISDAERRLIGNENSRKLFDL